MTTADAFGNCPAGVANSTGAAFPTEAKSTGGNGGASAIEKRTALASCNDTPRRAFGLCAVGCFPWWSEGGWSDGVRAISDLHSPP
jgi:hypothetical protein